MDLAHFFFQDGGAPGGAVGNSLRFRGAQYLETTFANAGNRRTWTFSVWVKRGKQTSYEIFNAGQGTSTQPRTIFRFDTDNTILIGFDYIGGSANWNYSKTTALYRDHSAWYHLTLKYDTTQADANERLVLWVNGARQPWQSYTAPTLNIEGPVCNSWQHAIGHYPSANTQRLDGYLAEPRLVDGQALEPTEFGEYNDDGVWVPIAPEIASYGTNGFHLDFSDPDDIGADRSGNGNNWTATGFELTDTTSSNYDWVADSPTQNYATLNPLASSASHTLNDGNLGTVAQNNKANPGTLGVNSGKWYWEIEINNNSGSCPYMGITSFPYENDPDASPTMASTVGRSFIRLADPFVFKTYSGTGISNGGTNQGSFGTLGVALDFDAGEVKFYKNNTLFHTDTSIPTDGTTLFPYIGKTFSSTWQSTDFNFGQRPLAYTPPAGFEPLNTAELPAVDITNPSDHFQTVTYQGTGTTNVQSTPGLKPGLVWIKKRSGGTDRSHQLFDTIRGGDKYLHTDLTVHNQVKAGAFTFLDEGFSVNTTEDGNNGSGNQYVAWCWSAPETITNAAGTNGATLATTVHRNKDSGFAIIEFTGNKQSNTKLYHGLGKAPKFMYFKTQEVNDWWVAYHASSGASDSTPGADWYYEANTSDQRKSYTLRNMWDRTDPDDNLITLGATDEANRNGGLMIAYAWAEVPGYSAFGSYTGNGSSISDGPFIFTGFKPAFVLFKNSTQATNWYLLDSKRGPYNEDYGNKNTLYPDRNAGEDNNLGYGVDFLSNGFKPRSPNGFGYNNTGQTCIYAAFAEHPFGGSNISPTTAR